MTNTVRSTALAAAFSLITASLLVVVSPLQAPAAGCGDPAPPPDGNGMVTGADALYCLQMAVGSQPVDLTTCDADDGGTATAADALRVLRVAVGQDVPLTCPGPPTTTTSSTTVTTSSTSTTLGAPALTWTDIAAMFQQPSNACSDTGLPCTFPLDCAPEATCQPTGGCLASNCHATSLTPACPTCCFGLPLGATCPLVTHASLVGVVSSEVPSLFLVQPGDAGASWMMDKLDGVPWVTGDPTACVLVPLNRCSDTLAACSSDANCTSPATCETWCGNIMPLALTPTLSLEFRDGVRSWINSGAPNN
jgi:hypothetical protein